MHFSRSLPSNSWWQTMVGCQVLSRPSAAEGGGRRPAFVCQARTLDWRCKSSAEQVGSNRKPKATARRWGVARQSGLAPRGRVGKKPEARCSTERK